MKRTVFFISDGTGLTASNLGHSLLTQFEQHIGFQKIFRPFIDTPEKAAQVIHEIDRYYQQDKINPLIFTTIIDSHIRHAINQSKGFQIDFFNTFLRDLETELQVPSSHSIGLTHGMQNSQSYHSRIDAVNYALSCDDGAGIQNYHQSDVILVGVSRCGKTPTSLYLALQFGIYTANYPFTSDDASHTSLVSTLKPFKKKLFGLTIDPFHLHEIRSQRRANSHYASLRQCQREIDDIESLYQQEKIPFIDTSVRSVEEIATTILNKQHLERKDF